MFDKMQESQEKGLFTFYKEQEEYVLPSKYLNKQKQFGQNDEKSKSLTKTDQKLAQKNLTYKLLLSKQSKTQNKNVKLQHQKIKKSQKTTTVNKNSKTKAVKSQTSFKKSKIIKAEQLKRCNNNQKGYRITRVDNYSPEQNPITQSKILTCMPNKDTIIPEIKTTQLKTFQNGCYSQDLQSQQKNQFQNQDQRVNGYLIHQTNCDKDGSYLQEASQNCRNILKQDRSISQKFLSNVIRIQLRRIYKKTLKSKTIRMNTEAIKPVLSPIFDHQTNQKESSQILSSFQNKHNPLNRYNILSQSQFRKNKFLAGNTSSFKNQEMLKNQNQEIYRPQNGDQSSINQKTSHNKILRFSLVKSLSLDTDTNKQTGKIGQIKQNSSPNKQISKIQGYQKIIKLRQEIKFPFIYRVPSSKQEKPAKLGHLPIKIKDCNVEPVNSTNILSKIKSKDRALNSKEQIEKHHRCYTNEDANNQTSKRQGSNQLLQKLRRSQCQQKQLLCIQKSLSSKVINSFHQQYYKKYQLQKQQRQLLSMLDMSKNSLIYDNQSFDWQEKKRQIIKKLGIYI